MASTSADAVGDEILQGFAFQSPLCLQHPVHIEQEAGRDIGFKLYPGALLLARYIEQTTGTSAALSGARALLELGAGICALPGLMLASGGARVVATDIPEVVARLASNIDGSSDCLQGRSGGSVKAAPLYWGRDVGPEHSCKSVLASMAADAAARGHGESTLAGSADLDLILGADIVYHEHLIEPLLHTLIDLTEPRAANAAASSAAAEPSKPPVVILSYVQRFKRAKAFFKLATQHFEVQAIPTRDVVDYEVLTWTLPRLLAITGETAHPLPSDIAVGSTATAGAGAADGRVCAGSAAAGSSSAASAAVATVSSGRSPVRPLLDSMSCDFEAMLPLLRRAAGVVRARRVAAAAAATVPVCPSSAAAAGGTGGEPLRGRAGSTDSTRSGRDLTDDGSVDPFTALRAGDVYRGAGEAPPSVSAVGGASSAAASAAPADAAPTATGAAPAARAARPHFGDGAAGTDKALIAETDALCAELGLTPLVPSRAYIYIMTRRVGKAAGGAAAGGAGAAEDSARGRRKAQALQSDAAAAAAASSR